MLENSEDINPNILGPFMFNSSVICVNSSLLSLQALNSSYNSSDSLRKSRPASGRLLLDTRASLAVLTVSQVSYCCVVELKTIMKRGF